MRENSSGGKDSIETSYYIKLSSGFVSACQPNRRNLSEIKMEKFSSCVDLGLDVVEQEVKTEELEVDREQYKTYSTSPETEIKTKEVIVNETLDQRIDTQTTRFIKIEDEGKEDKFMGDQCSFETSNLRNLKTHVDTFHRNILFPCVSCYTQG